MVCSQPQDHKIKGRTDSAWKIYIDLLTKGSALFCGGVFFKGRSINTSTRPYFNINRISRLYLIKVNGFNHYELASDFCPGMNPNAEKGLWELSRHRKFITCESQWCVGARGVCNSSQLSMFRDLILVVWNWPHGNIYTMEVGYISRHVCVCFWENIS